MHEPLRRCAIAAVEPGPIEPEAAACRILDEVIVALDLVARLPPPFPCRMTDSRCFAAVTVSVVLALPPKPSVAATVVVPGPTPVASPDALTVATDGLLLAHVKPVRFTLTGVDTSAVLPFPSWP